MKKKTKEVRSELRTTMSAEQLARGLTKVATTPICNAAGVIEAFSIHGALDYLSLVRDLNVQCRQIQTDDLSRAESMLIAQAHSLDAMFASLARSGVHQEGLKQYETQLKLALKAQSQCRATLETLAAIKNPPIFAKQANIAHGPQQVNNEAAGVARVENIEKTPTELLERDHGQRLDTGTTRAASGSNQAVEAVATVHRSAHATRKGKRSA